MEHVAQARLRGASYGAAGQPLQSGWPAAAPRRRLFCNSSQSRSAKKNDTQPPSHRDRGGAALARGVGQCSTRDPGVAELLSLQRLQGKRRLTPLDFLEPGGSPGPPEVENKSNCKREITNRPSRDESQWIVAQRPLSHLQYPDANWIVCPGFPVLVSCTTLAPPLLQWKDGTCGCQANLLDVFLYTRGRKEAPLVSMDPSLEAFSGNPADGSVAVLVFQLTAFTKYLNELFLSY